MASPSTKRRDATAAAALTRLTAAAGAAAALLVGCATPRTIEATLPPADIPAQWSASAVALPARATRLPFDDPALLTLVQAALARSPTIASAAATLEQARALRDLAAAGLRPTLGASGSAQRSGSGDGSTSNSFKLGLDAGWELDLFGAGHAAVAAREAELAAAGATLADAQVSIAAETALAYLEIRSAQQRLAIAQANLEAQRQTLQIAQWRAQAGLASSLEVEQARGSALQVEAQQAVLRASLQQAGHALALLTGRPPGAVQATVDAAAPLPTVPDSLTLTLPADTLRQRPDVRAAEWSWRAAAERVTQARAETLPTLRLGGSIGLSAPTLGALTNSGAFLAALLGSVSWPVFDGGAADANVRAQQAALVKAAEGWRAAVLGALQEVEDALVALRHDRERHIALTGAAEAAANAALLARQRYSSGLVDFQTVLETQRTLLSAQDGVATAEAAIASDHVRLFKALGGNWSADGATGALNGAAPDRTSTARP